MDEKHWSVSVSVNGVNVLNISDQDLSGVENVGDFRAEILEAAEHLVAFIGPGPDQPPVSLHDSLPW